VDAYDNAGAAGFGDPKDWTDAQQAKLCDELYKLRPEPHTGDGRPWLTRTLDKVYQWPGSWADKPNRGWTMPLDGITLLPRIAGLANARTDTNVAYVVPFTVDFRGQAATGAPTVTSSNASVVAAGGIALAGAAPNFTLTLTPVGGATGTTNITVTADNGTTNGLTFALTVGGKVQAKAPTQPRAFGLSTRHRSFVLDRSEPL
jgi:hypothetical protein